MIKLKIRKKEDNYITEETVDNVYDFDFDFKVGYLIVKYLDDEKATLKMISINNIERIIGYEVN